MAAHLDYRGCHPRVRRDITAVTYSALTEELARTLSHMMCIFCRTDLRNGRRIALTHAYHTHFLYKDEQRQRTICQICRSPILTCSTCRIALKIGDIRRLVGVNSGYTGPPAPDPPPAAEDRRLAERLQRRGCGARLKSTLKQWRKTDRGRMRERDCDRSSSAGRCRQTPLVITIM